MRRNEKGDIILTGKKASELFLLLSNARYKLNGKMRTTADRYWKEFEGILDLDPNSPNAENTSEVEE